MAAAVFFSLAVSPNRSLRQIPTELKGAAAVKFGERRRKAAPRRAVRIVRRGKAAVAHFLTAAAA